MPAKNGRKTRAELIAELHALRRHVASLETRDMSRESEERYRRLVRFLPESVRITCNGFVVYANEAAAEIYGARTPDELIGRCSDDFIPMEERPRVAERRRMLASLGALPLEEQRRRRLDGSLFFVDVMAMQIDWNGQPAQLIISRDVTRRVLARRALAETGGRLAAIAENLPGAAYECVVHPNGRIAFTYISAGVQELFGVSPEEVRARASALLKRIHPEDRPVLARAMGNVLASGERVEVEFRTLPSDGRTAWVRSIAGFRRRDGDSMIWDGVLIDDTERRLALDALRESKEAAELANRTKTVFLANMSHELRTPLNAVMGFSEVIEREMFGPVGAPQYKEYASDIRASGEHLLQLINDILDLSKIEAGMTELHEAAVDIAGVIESSVTLLKQRAAEGNIRLAVRIASRLPQIRADETKIRQVVLNLLSNALKYTPSGGEVKVTASASGGGGLSIEIADTGIGIRPEDVPTALMPFGQVDNPSNRRQRGTGLGLPLAKSLVERHGGELQLDSRPGKGTTVTVHFPPVRLVA